MLFSQFAGLFADPTRGAMCLALLDGRAWTLGELARHAHVTPSTASEHVSKLVVGGVLAEERQGRHRYVRLADTEVAHLIELLASFSTENPAPRSLREAGRRDAEARARTCYDHLAGRLGVAVSEAMVDRGLLRTDAGLFITEDGARWVADLGIDLPALTRHSRRPVVRTCLDWTERRTHVAGVVGAALCATAFERQWVERLGTGRALRVTSLGSQAFRHHLGFAGL